LKALIVHNGSLAGTYFYGYDGNGNVAALVNGADGSEAARYEYGPFGELLRATGPMAKLNPFRFSTKYQDDETGFLYYGYRYYNPTIGRWLSRDPVEEDGGLNLYGFVASNPVSLVDFLGLWDTRAHEKIIDDWLGDRFPDKVHCGCCTIDLRQLLKNASARSDGLVGVHGFHWLPNANPFSSHSVFRQQSVGASAEHAMSGLGQDWLDAVFDFEDIVSDRMAAADETLNGSGDECKKLKKAVAALGSAVHAVADDHSPSHRGHQDWNGLVYGIMHPGGHRSGESLKVWKKNDKDWNQGDRDSTILDLNNRFGPLINQIMSGCEK